jgi:hypothetical protein
MEKHTEIPQGNLNIEGQITEEFSVDYVQYCRAYGDYMRRGLDCQLDLLDLNTVHSITV